VKENESPSDVFVLSQHLLEPRDLLLREIYFGRFDGYDF
jgi:hypothetical protein